MVKFIFRKLRKLKIRWKRIISNWKKSRIKLIIKLKNKRILISWIINTRNINIFLIIELDLSKISFKWNILNLL